MNRLILLILALSLSLSSDCTEAMPSFMERAYGAQKRACQAGFEKEYVKAGVFTLTTYQRCKAPSETIRIYIEGDGRAWESRTRLSDDPTPSDPVALDLAVADPSEAVAYIARPGQFPQDGIPDCDPTYWSARRFSSEVVESFDKAIDIVKKKSGASRLELVGYSGGGALAVLVAARRGDITALRTVAGNLDPRGLCDYHKVSRLDASMDPLECAQKVASIPQRHFVGSDDTVVPASIARSFIMAAGDRDDKRITVVNCASHAKGWPERWPELLAISVD